MTLAHSAIDGDISDFIDSLIDRTEEFSTDELYAFLLTAGHPIADTISAVFAWRKNRFKAIDPSWTRFTLTAAGRAAVRDLRDRRRA